MAVAERRLGVLGTLVWDTNWHPGAVGGEARAVEQWGGITYSLAALEAAAPPGWRVVPLIKVGADLATEAGALLRGFSRLERGGGMRTVAEPNNRVELRYHDDAERGERLTGGVPPWSAAEILPLLPQLDALYVNFISGMEMELGTAEAVRSAFAGPIYADLHSLFLGPPPPDGPRPPRRLPERDRWLRCFDIVQLNAAELALLAADGGPGSAAEVCGRGPLAALITLGPHGAEIAARATLPGGAAGWAKARARSSPGPVLPTRVAPPGGALSGDPTGCGDVWGSTVFASLLAGAPLEEAARRAHRAAAAKLRVPLTQGLPRALREALGPGGG